MLSGIHEILRTARQCRTTQIDGDGQFQVALERVRKHLRASRARRVLVGAATDPSALGALRAFEEAGREGECVVVGQNGEPEARLELRVPRTRLIGSVRLLPRKVRGRRDPARPRNPGEKDRSAGSIHQTPAHHTRYGGPSLSERQSSGPGRQSIRNEIIPQKFLAAILHPLGPAALQAAVFACLST